MYLLTYLLLIVLLTTLEKHTNNTSNNSIGTKKNIFTNNQEIINLLLDKQVLVGTSTFKQNSKHKTTVDIGRWYCEIYYFRWWKGVTRFSDHPFQQAHNFISKMFLHLHKFSYLHFYSGYIHFLLFFLITLINSSNTKPYFKNYRNISITQSMEKLH